MNKKEKIFVLMFIILTLISIYFYIQNLQLKSKNIELLNINNKYENTLNEIKKINQIENNLGIHYSCTKEYEFDFNKKNLSLLEDYNNVFTNNYYIRNIYSNYWITNSSFRFFLDDGNLELAKKELKGINIGKLSIDTEKVDLLVNLLNHISTKKIFIDLGHLSVGFNNKTTNNSELNLLLDFLNSKLDEKEIIRLGSLGLDLPFNYTYSDENIEKLEKLKVNTLELSAPLKDSVKFLKNSKYIEQIVYPDGIKYNSKKAFYFIKRNGKIYAYDNGGNEINEY